MTTFTSNTDHLAHYQRLAADATDAAWVEREVHRHSPSLAGGIPALTEAQIVEAAGLASALYEAAAAFGVDRRAVGGVTDFVAAAVDGIRARDRR